MSNTPVVRCPAVVQGETQAFLARIESGGDPIVSGDVSSVTLASYLSGSLVDGPDTLSGTVTALVTSTEWVIDGTGYNFRHIAASTFFPTAGNVYRLVFTITLTNGEVRKLLYDVPVISATT